MCDSVAWLPSASASCAPSVSFRNASLLAAAPAESNVSLCEVDLQSQIDPSVIGQAETLSWVCSACWKVLEASSVVLVS